MSVDSPMRSGLAVLVLFIATACSNGSSSIEQDTDQLTSGTAPPADRVPAPPDEPASPSVPVPEPAPPPISPDSVPNPAPFAPMPETDATSALPAALAGYWRGAVTRDKSRENLSSIAFVTAQGEAQLLVMPQDSSQFVLQGNLCCESTIEERMRALRRETTRTEISPLKGRLAGTRLAGDFEFRDRDYGFALNREAGSDAALSLPGVAGVYSGSIDSDGDDALSTVAINADGQVTGALPERCAFSGTLAIAHPPSNMLEFTVNMAGCRTDRFNGAYTGLGVMTGSNELTFSLIGPTWLGAQVLRK